MPDIESERDDMTFAQFVERINELAQKAGLADKSGRYCADDEWIDAYEDGLSPREAWKTEMEYVDPS